ncbi:hypothetical protein LTR85_009843 [Meristemomyces frigidus]|nr:hypothetical protein LTR85_009843 [Meristemomyces frigidus]
MQHFPQELRLIIIEASDIVTAECFRQTSRSLWYTKREYTPGMFAEDLYELAVLIRKDCYHEARREEMAGKEPKHERRVCSYCQEAHHKSKFDSQALKEHWSIRTCEASERGIVCSHVATHHNTLRRMIDANLARSSLDQVHTMPCCSISTDDGLNPPIGQQIKLDKTSITLSSTYALARSSAGILVMPHIPERALSRLDVSICQHLNVSDKRVIASYDAFSVRFPTAPEGRTCRYCRQCESKATKCFFNRDTTGAGRYSEAVYLHTEQNLGQRFPRPQNRRWLEHSVHPRYFWRVVTAKQAADEQGKMLLS